MLHKPSKCLYEREEKDDTFMGSVAKIHLPHKILWQMPIHSHYRMWSKYFLQQNPKTEIIFGRNNEEIRE
jgi:hypothetical protein